MIRSKRITAIDGYWIVIDPPVYRSVAWRVLDPGAAGAAPCISDVAADAASARERAIAWISSKTQRPS